MAVGWLASATAAASLALVLVGCSHRNPGTCTVTCAEDGLCPDGTSCGGDGYCHAADETGSCSEILDRPDGAPDGSDGGEDPGDADPCDGVPGGLSAFDPANYSIPDGILQGIDLPLSLDSDGCVTVETVEVRVEILHAYRGDVELYLTSPAGDTELLLASSDDSAANIFRSFLVDIATGESADGDWVLNVSDVVTPDAGTLDYWSIGINRAAP
jgi:hypothetical protein